jgi:hypothetical protein
VADAVETPVPDVVHWIARVAPQDAARLLIGCLLDDGVADTLTQITALDHQRKGLILEDGRFVPLARLRAGVIVDPRPNAPLRQAIVASRTPAEQQERVDRAALGRAGIDPDRLASESDRQAVLELVRAEAVGALTDYPARHAGYLALSAGEDAAVARIGARLFAGIAERHGAKGTVPDDLHWRRAWFLRASGQLREAVAVSDVLHSAAPSESRNRNVLAAVRTGALLDLFDADGDARWVSLAEQAAVIALAAFPRDDAAWNMERRLKAAQRRLGRIE